MTDGTRSGDPVHALLADGTTACIRPARPEDRPQLLALYREMSPEHLRLRFPPRAAGPPNRPRNGRAPRPGPAIWHCSRRSGGGWRVWPSTTGRTSPPRPRPSHTPPAPPPRAPRAPPLPVPPRSPSPSARACTGRGIGTLLLEHLVSAARADGVTSFTAVALAENRAVLEVFADLGLSVARRLDGPELHCVIRLDEDDTYLSAVEARGRGADVASLEPLLRPNVVAVVGAGRKPGSVGRAILRNLRTGGFPRWLFAVNPHVTSLLGVPAFPSVTSLPRVPDLAVLAVPAASLVPVAEECGKTGVRALVVVTAGLDAALGADLLAVCRRYGMRLVGPNCLGVANTDRGMSLDATFAAHHPRPGTVGVAVQSGGVGIALLSGLSRLGLGTSSFVSLGDKYDVSGNDLLQWWESDGRTEVALLHLESFGNPRAFSRTARRVTRRIPVLTVDAGRTDTGRRAAASHTAAAATRTVTRQALFTQAGITATRTIGELLDTAALFQSQPLPGGDRIAIVTNAGGAGVLAADACAEAGLQVSPLGPDTVERLLAVLPDDASAANPVDTTAAVSEEQLGLCVDQLAECPGVDAVLVVLVPTAVAAATGDDLSRVLSRTPGRRSRTVAAVLLGQDTSVSLLPCADGGHVPCYADPQAAARALAHAVRRARWLARPAGTVPSLTGVDASRAHALVEGWLAARPDGGWLEPAACADLLDCYGIPQIPWAWVRSEDEAVLAAERLAGDDGRVVLKAHWPGLLHKSTQHAVLLDLRGDGQVRSAYRDLETRFEGLLTGVVVQPQAARGTELFAGVVQDGVFGPLVMFGLGGTAADVLADRSALLAPLTGADLHDLLTAPRCAPLLFGQGGGGPVDLEGLEQVLARLSAMACDLPQLAEADLNPVLARPDGVTALDVRVRLLPRTAHDPYLRRLR
ncbi:acyl-CoA synthetase [Streptomyces spiroverticillatus]